MKYLITQKQRDAILSIPGYSNLKESIRELKPIEPLSDEAIDGGCRAGYEVAYAIEDKKQQPRKISSIFCNPHSPDWRDDVQDTDYLNE